MPTWFAAAVALVTLISALAIGSVHTGVLIAIGAASAVLGVIAVRIAPVPGASWVLFGLAAWSAVQAIPLPFGLLQVLSPHNAGVWAGALRPLGELAPSLAPLSLDPGASLLEASKWFSYGCVFAAASLAGRGGAPGWGARVAFGCALVVAVLTLLHGLAGATRVYGFYQPSFHAVRWRVGPLLNSNNLAGYLNFGMFAGLGLLLGDRDGRLRPVLGVAIVLLLASSVLAGSRGGAVSFGVGLVAFAIGAVRSTRRTHGSRAARAVLALLTTLLVGGAGAVLLRGTDDVGSELLDRNVDKLALVDWAQPMLRNAGALGIGRGAFDSVFPAYDSARTAVRFSHAENLVVEWASEWGVPVTLVAGLALIWCFRRAAFGTAHSFTGLGVFIAVCAMGLQNLMDLGLEVPGVCLLVATATGAATGERLGALSERPKRSRARGLALAGVALCVLGLAFQRGRTPAYDERLDLAQEYRGALRAGLEQGEIDRLVISIRGAMERHPADPYFPQLGALVAQRAGKNPMPWINRALERDMNSGRLHYLTARFLAERGAYAQARGALRRTVENEVELAEKVGERAVSWSTDVEQVIAVAPRSRAGARVLTSAARRLDPDRQASARRTCLAEASKRDPAYAAPIELFTRDSIADLGRASVCGAGPAAECVRRVESGLTALQTLNAQAVLVLTLRAALLKETRRASEAEQLLAQQCPTLEAQTDRVTCHIARAECAAAVDDQRLAAAALALSEGACPPPDACAKAESALGRIYAARGDWRTALEHYSSAARNEPSAERWHNVALAAERLGLKGRAGEAATQERRARDARAR